MNLDRRSVLKAAGAAGAGTLLPASSVGAPSGPVDGGLDTDSALPQEVLVVFDERDDVGVLDRFDLDRGFYGFEVLPVAYTVATGSQIEAIAELPAVRHVERNRELEYHNADARAATGVDRVHHDRVKGDSVHAVVVDSGVDGDHPDLRGNLRHNYQFTNPLSGDAMWVDVGTADTDTVGHGTHVSGTVAGTGAASGGEYRGMAPNADLTVYAAGATLVLLKAVGAYDHMLARMEAGEETFHVVNNSYGSVSEADYNPAGALETATFEAFERGVLSVFSAGNSGPATDTLNDYAKGPHVLGVAATDDDRNVTDFSSRGRLPTYGGANEPNYDRGRALANLRDYYAARREQPEIEGAGLARTGTVGRGVDVRVDEQGERVGASAYEPIEAADVPEEAGTAEIRVTWTGRAGATVEDLDFYLRRGAEDGPVVARDTSAGQPVTFRAPVDPGETYYLEVRPAAVVEEVKYNAFVEFRRAPSVTPTRPYGVYRIGVAAPGELVESTMSPGDALQGYQATGGDREAVEGTIEDNSEPGQDAYYARVSGTSMSGPVVAGIAALVVDARHLEGWGTPDPMAVLDHLETYAYNAKPEGYNAANAGTGFVDGFEAVDTALYFKELADDATVIADGPLPLKVSGSRTDDGLQYTAGQTDTVEVAVSANRPVVVRDRVPEEWDVLDGYGTHHHVEHDPDAGVRYVYFTPADEGTKSVQPGENGRYFAEAPSGVGATGRYQFGPVEVRPEGETTWQSVPDTTDTNVVVGARSDPRDAGTNGEAGDGDVVDETTDAVDETTDAVDETTDAVDGTTDAVDETTDAVDGTTDAVDETTDTVDGTTDAVDDALSGGSSGAGGADGSDGGLADDATDAVSGATDAL